MQSEEELKRELRKRVAECNRSNNLKKVIINKINSALLRADYEMSIIIDQ